MTARNYGAPPEVFALGPSSDGTIYFGSIWTEYMHYLYLPVVMPEHEVPYDIGKGHIRLPPNLEFLRELIEAVCDNEQVVDDDTSNATKFVYVTARRGFATPGNPLNRPGWHADGFGTDDVNYIWSNRWPTRFAIGEFREISDNHVLSAEQFEYQIIQAEEARHAMPQWVAKGLVSDIRVINGEPNTVYRLTPDVIHATPLIDAPGGDRSFFKISVSSARYNLVGNSHNYLFDYAWRMYNRATLRNDPAYAGGDSGPQE